MIGYALLLATAQAGAEIEPSRIASLEEMVRVQDARIRELETKLEAMAAKSPAHPAPATSAPAPVRIAQSGVAPVKLRGRLQVEAVFSDPDGAIGTGTQIRRLYLGAEGKLGANLRYQAEADFAGNKVSIQDALVGWQASPSTEIVAGYFKPPITADDMTSDVYTLFLERSAYAGLFAPGRRVGIGVNHAGKGWGLRGGLFGERDDAALDTGRNEGWVASLRGHADLLPGEGVLHAALSGYYSEPSTDGVSLSQRPETNRAPLALDTGRFAAEHGLFLGGEIGLGEGPLTLQAEGGTLAYSGPAADPRFTGYSVQLAYRWTGEARPYDAKAGLFGRVTPRRAVSVGGIGAIETGLRLTSVDLGDDGIGGGRLTTYGVVVNWYPLTRIRLSGNLVHARVRDGRTGDRDATALALRGGIDW